MKLRYLIFLLFFITSNANAQLVLGPGDLSFSLWHQDKLRTYQVHVPVSYNLLTPMPLVIAIHGGGGNGEGMRVMTEMDADSEVYGFIVVYPDGTGARIFGKTLGSWNAGRCCPPAMDGNVDDVGFISKMIDRLSEDFNIDKNKVYATGMSNGALMSYRLGCELSDKIAAIAPIGAHDALPAGCAPERVVPTLHFHGTEDNCAPYDPAGDLKCGGCMRDFLCDLYPALCPPEAYQWECSSVPDYIDDWRILNRNQKAPEVDDAEIILKLIENMGHTWPGGNYGTICQGAKRFTKKCIKYREIVGKLRTDIEANEIMWAFFRDKALTCGNDVCETYEDETNCPKDCKIPQRCKDVYAYHERICTEQMDWESFSVDVDGIRRNVLWKAPSSGAWTRGAIIAMHGGSGHASNFCSGPRIAKPMEAFSRLALQEGFAVFSPDSTYARITDKHGLSVGKRWDSLYQKGRKNIDLAFLKKLLSETIPAMRPTGSRKGIFMTGISNGGFMTILAAVHFKNELTAFAPVSAGDPFRTYFDMTTHPLFERTCAPGVFRDSDTHQKINKRNACRIEDASANLESDGRRTIFEKPIPFKQFHHTGDAACDFSCMQKARRFLVNNGFRDDGAYIVDRGRRKVAHHFWQNEYNEPIINFFKQYAIPTDPAAK